MLTLKRETVTIGNFEFELLCDEKSNNFYFTEASLEKGLQLGERSIRNFLVGKSPEASNCRGFRSGKSAKIQGCNVTVKIWNLVVVENFIAYKAKQGNQPALELLVTCASLGLHALVATAFGQTITRETIDYWNLLHPQGVRQPNNFTDAIRDYSLKHPEYKANYGKLTDILYSMLGLPKGRDSYNEKQLELIKRCERELTYYIVVLDRTPEIALQLLKADWHRVYNL